MTSRFLSTGHFFYISPWRNSPVAVSGGSKMRRLRHGVVRGSHTKTLYTVFPAPRCGNMARHSAGYRSTPHCAASRDSLGTTGNWFPDVAIGHGTSVLRAICGPCPISGAKRRGTSLNWNISHSLKPGVAGYFQLRSWKITGKKQTGVSLTPALWVITHPPVRAKNSV